jgi:hypothetical protein
MMPGEMTRWTNLKRALAAGVLACAVLAPTGCKYFQKDGSGMGRLLSRGPDRPDPLLGSRIPATDLPIPGRGEGYGSNTSDPLLQSPNPNEEERSSMGRRREPFRPGRDETPAGLTSGLKPSDTGLSIGDRADPRVNGGLAIRGPVPLVPGGEVNSVAYSEVIDALRRFDARWAEPTREGDEYVFRADVPVEGGADGAMRRYEGAGKTPTAAAKQVLDQIQSDRGF